MALTSPNSSDLVSGVLLVNCEDKACRRVIDEAHKVRGVKHAFRVSKKFNDSGADVIIRMEAPDKQIMTFAEMIKRFEGVKATRHKISCK